MSTPLCTLYPAIEPYDSGLLTVGDGHKIYWEVCGNPKGKAALFLHGGPGGGCSPDHRRLFNPKKYRIVLFDQRGCGRSKPHAGLTANTTQHLIADIEKLRDHLGIEKWVVLGGSWGSTLALAYAEKHAKRVLGLVLRGIFTGTKRELDWFYQDGASHLFPDSWDKFIAPLTKAERKNIMKSYARRMASQTKKTRIEAVRAWAQWESETCRLIPSETSFVKNDAFAIAFSSIENHYFMNKCFLREDELIRNARKLAALPGFIIQGRYDVVCPVEAAWRLHKAWPKAKLHIVPDAGHAYNEPGILDATIRATDALARNP